MRLFNTISEGGVYFMPRCREITVEASRRPWISYTLRPKQGQTA